MSDKILNYKVLESINRTSLATAVLSYTKTGWTLMGGVMFANGNYCQAIVEYEQETL